MQNMNFVTVIIGQFSLPLSEKNVLMIQDILIGTVGKFVPYSSIRYFWTISQVITAVMLAMMIITVIGCSISISDGMQIRCVGATVNAVIGLLCVVGAFFYLPLAFVGYVFMHISISMDYARRGRLWYYLGVIVIAAVTAGIMQIHFDQIHINIPIKEFGDGLLYFLTAQK